MNRALYEVKQMDCAAEESLVRMKLEEVASVRALDFDLSRRTVAVYHEGSLDDIERALHEIDLGSSLVESSESSEEAPPSAVQRSVLWAVLLINFGFFVLEVTTGLISGSMGLVADSLDMLADAIVYGLSLIVVGGTIARKKSVARWSGYFQLTLAAFGIVEVLRRFSGVEALPDFRAMIVVALLALIANSVSLYLLHRSKSKEAHMSASMIFTSNDIIINLGVITAGILVSLLGSNLPDLIVGAVVFAVVIRGAFRILQLAR